MELLEKQISDVDFENQYKNLIENADFSVVNEFDKKYVQAREDLIKTNFKFWDNLDEPYPFFFKVKELSDKNKVNFKIITNKKKLPVLNKLKKFNLNVDVYANEDLQKYVDKGFFIKDYLEKNKLRNAVLIEYSSINISNCKKYKKINCYLVNWGYISPKEKGLNLKQIIEKIQVKNEENY